MKSSAVNFTVQDVLIHSICTLRGRARLGNHTNLLGKIQINAHNETDIANNQLQSTLQPTKSEEIAESWLLPPRKPQSVI